MKKVRALIVEDNDVMRYLLIQMLQLTGLAEFQFTEAKDGLEAVAEFKAEGTDILFVDWQMPKMNGLDFVRKVRAWEKQQRIPVVMMTGEGKVGKLKEALNQAGVDAYLTKPYTIEALKRNLSRLVVELEPAGA